MAGCSPATTHTIRLAYRVAFAYAERVEGGTTVVEADAGSEPIGLLDCFIGACLTSRQGF